MRKPSLFKGECAARGGAAPLKINPPSLHQYTREGGQRGIGHTIIKQGGAKGLPRRYAPRKDNGGWGKRGDLAILLSLLSPRRTAL